MKIHYEIARRTVDNELKHFIDSKPSLSRMEALTEWIMTKFKTVILSNVIDDENKFIIEPILNEPEGFKITFTDDADGLRFISIIGGRVDD